MGNYMNHEVMIDKFTTTEVAGETFGGFKCDKYINSQPNATAYNGLIDVAADGAIGTVPGISRLGIPVWKFIRLPSAMIACCNKGKGYHLTTVYERASIAFLSQKLGTMPHGDNKNVNPPCDYTYTTEIGLLDKYEYVRSSGSNMMALPGTGPNTWAHNHLASGVFDLNGLVSEWAMGLFLEAITGYVRVLASTDVSYTGSPYGRGTVSGSGTATPLLTLDGAGINWKKEWTVSAFDGLEVYIAEASGMITVLNGTPTAAGSGYTQGDVLTITTGGFGATCYVKTVGASGEVTSVGLMHGGGGYTTGAGKATTGGTGDGNCTVNITTVNTSNQGAFFPIASTAAGALTLGNGANPPDGAATFVIVKRVATDITSGMASGNKILTIRNADANLKYFAIPLTSDGTGSAVYGNDGYWFDKTTEYDKAALCGGDFGNESNAGVFCLCLNVAPSNVSADIGFRACKAL